MCWNQFWFIFIDFGAQVGSKIQEKSMKNRLEIIQKNYQILMSFFLKFCRFWGPCWMVLGGFSAVVLRFFCLLLAPRAKMAPRPLQEGVRDRFWTIFHRFLVDFLPIFGQFLKHFWSNFGNCLIESRLMFKLISIII